MKEGHLYTEGIVKSDYPEIIKAQIAQLPSDADVIIHHIKSPGGNVYAAWKAIPELMKIGKPIKSLIEGEASSIASWIAIAPAFEVEATNPSTMLIHEPFFPEGLDGALGVDDLDNAKTELSQIRQSMAEAYARKSGKTVDEMLALMKNNTRLTAGMAEALGLVDRVHSIEPRRIAAEAIEEIRKEFKSIKDEFMNLFGKKAAANASPSALDLPLKNGKMLSVSTENGDLVNKKATIDGQPAEGTYDLADGRQLMCSGGMITAVKEYEPQETAQQKLEKQMQALNDQLTQIKATEEARIKMEEQAKIAASEKAKQDELAKALEVKTQEVAALAKKVEELEGKPLGDQNKPFEGMKTMAVPYGIDKTPEDKKVIMATRTLLADYLPWLETKYKDGKYPDGTTFQSYRSSGGENAVSILETNLNYSWNGVLSTDLFFKPTIGSPALADIFTLDLGAADKKRYHISPVMNKVLKPYTGCGQAVTGSSFDITSKAIQLKPFEMYEGWCKDDFTDQLVGSYNVLAQEWLKTGTESFDPAGTPVDRMIIKLLKDALRRDIFRRVSFADKDSSNADWNQFDGFWPNLIDQSGGSNYCVQRIGSALGTGTLAANTAQTYFENIWDNSSDLLQNYAIDSGRGQFLVTRSIWNNYYKTLTGAGAVTEQQFSNLVSGIAPPLTFRGIPVIPIGLWDDQLKDSTNPLFSTTRHLIAYTVKDNHILGVENTADLDKIDSWFEKKDNKRYYRSNMIMGFLGAIHCELTTISF
jgi:ATP-dependent protease ClpP protease subunit